MPCAFRLTYDSIGGRVFIIDSCQFEPAERDLVSYGGETWCTWHLPLEAKKDWEEGKVAAFNTTVASLLSRVPVSGGEANLAGVVFPGDFYIEEGQDLPRCLFVEAEFGGDADFQRAWFGGDATPFGDAYFQGAKFGGRANFIEAKFGGNADFSGAEFGGVALFASTKFRGSAKWIGAEFGGWADFSRAEFGGETDFTEAEFGGEANFSGAVFRGDANFSASMPGEREDNRFFWVSFEGRRFGGRALFTNRRFLSTTSFRGATFEKAPEFHGCELHQDTDFYDAQFLEQSPEAARHYRTLKLAMEAVRARAEQSRFFAYEQRCLRADPKTNWFLRFVSWLYDLTSDYGQSLWKPLAFLLATFALFWFGYGFYVYLLAAQTPGAPDPHAILEFDLQQVFRPFGAFSRAAPGLEELIGGGTSWVPRPAVSRMPLPLGLKLLAALHSVLNFGLLTLFIVAVRRRFSMG